MTEFNPTAAIDHLAPWVREAKSAVAFTGAGISTESGIPDFRSPGGIWSKYQPVYYQDFMRDADARQEYWRQKSEGHRDFANAKPNVAHEILARWEQTGRLRGVITQNIDGLHRKAGSHTVLELHGTALEVKCQDCLASFPAGPYVEQFLATQQVPPCPACNGPRLKAATVSFGQQLPADVLQKSIAWAKKTDLFLAIGSSLVVEPAASLPRMAKEQGGRLVIINRDETPLDGIADLVIREAIGATLSAVADQVQSR